MSHVATQAEQDLQEIMNLIDSIENIEAFATKNSVKSEGLSWLGCLSESGLARLQSPRLSLFVGDYGFADSARESGQPHHSEYVNNFVSDCHNGTLKLNQLCSHANCDLRLYEMGSNQPFSLDDLIRSFSYGLISVEQGIDFLAIGSCGLFVDEVAKAIIYAHKNSLPDHDNVVDIRTEKLLKDNSGAKGFDCLRRIGGPELSAMCGVILAARMAGIPILLEGYGAFAAYEILSAHSDVIGQHCALTGKISEDFLNSLSIPFLPPPYDLVSNEHAMELCGISSACLIPQLKNEILLSSVIAPR